MIGENEIKRLLVLFSIFIIVNYVIMYCGFLGFPQSLQDISRILLQLNHDHLH
jgi:hypothetical protein